MGKVAIARMRSPARETRGLPNRAQTDMEYRD
jgi:hypothetical protein